MKFDEMSGSRVVLVPRREGPGVEKLMRAEGHYCGHANEQEQGGDDGERGQGLADAHAVIVARAGGPGQVVRLGPLAIPAGEWRRVVRWTTEA